MSTTGADGDIKLLFSVDGNGTIAAGSGKIIYEQLLQIVTEINDSPFKIRFEADETSLNQIRDRIRGVVNSVGATTAPLNVNVSGSRSVSTQSSQEAAQYNDAKRAVENYYNALSELLRVKKYVSQTETGWQAERYGFEQVAEELNRTKTAYDLMTNAEHTAQLSMEHQIALKQLMTEKTREYALAVEAQERRDMSAEASAQAQANAILAKEAEAEKAAAARQTNTALQNQINAWVGVDAATKSAKESAEVFKSAAQEHTQTTAMLVNLDNLYTSITEHLKEWTAATGNAALQGHVETLRATATSAQDLYAKLKAGSITVGECAEEFQKLQLAATTASNAIKLAGADKPAMHMLVPGTKEYDAALKSVASALERVTANQKKWTAAEHGRSRHSYAALRAYSAQLEQLTTDLELGKVSQEDFAKRFKKISTDIAIASSKIRAAGENVQSLRDRFMSLTKSLGVWFSSMQLIMYAIRIIRSMVTATRELDDAFAQLKIVTGATDAEMKSFALTTVDLAKSLGRSASEVAKSIETFSRLGYGLNDASKLAEYATILANTAAVSSDEATTGLTAILKGYDLDVRDSEHIADLLISVGQKYAVSASEMMEAYEKSGAALNATNTSLEKSAGLIAAGNAAVQNAGTVGTALKTVAARIRGSKSDLEELGESTEDLADGFSKYAAEVKALTGFNIMVEGTTNQFKDLYDIMDGISRVWDKLSDTQRARVSEILGGTRQLQVISSIIDNWDDATAAYNTAMNSQGTSARALGVYMQTASAHVAQFKASFQDLSSTLLSSGLISFFVNLGKSLLDAMNALAKIHLLLPSIAASLIAINVARKAMSSYRYVGEITKELVAKKAVTDAAKASVAELTLREKQLLMTQLNRAVVQGKLTDEEAKGIVAALGLAGAEGTLDVTTKGLTASFKALMSSIPVWGWVAIAISFVIEAIVWLSSSVSTATEQLQKLKDEYKDNESGLNNLNDQLKTTADRLAELRGKDNPTFVEKEELERLQQQNKDLERQVHLLEQRQRYLKQEANKSFVKQMRDTYTENVVFMSNVDTGLTTAEMMAVNIDKLHDYREQLLDTTLSDADRADINRWIDLIEKSLYEQFDNMDTLSADIEYIINPVTDDDKAVNAFLDLINDLKDKFAIVMGGENAKSDAFARIVNNWKFDQTTQELEDLGKTGQVTADMLNDPAYTDFLNKLVEVGVISDTTETALNDVALAFNTIGESADKAISKIDSGVSAWKKWGTMLEELIELGDEYNALVNGNVDYNKRPYISPDKMAASGWDIGDNEIATTLTQGYLEEQTGLGKYKYAITVTPILENGEVLSQGELDAYVHSLVNESDSAGDILERDYKKLIVNVSEGEFADPDILKRLEDVDISVNIDPFEELESKLGDIKDKHAEIARAIGVADENIAQIISSVNRYKTEFFSDIQQLSDGLDQIDKIYSDIKDGGKFDWGLILNNKNFTEAFGELGDVYNDFIATIEKYPNDINACQTAFDKLTTAYLNHSEILNGVTSATRDETVARLKEMGITNAALIVDKALAFNKQKLAWSTKVATVNTWEEAASMLGTATAGNVNKQALAELLTEKLLYNDNKIDTLDECQQLLNMANTARATTADIQRLTDAQALFEEANELAKQVAFDPNMSILDRLSIYRQVGKLRKEAEELANQPISFDRINLDDILLQYTGGNNGETAAEKALREKKEAFKNEYDAHKHKVQMELESEQSYYDWLEKRSKEVYDAQIIDEGDYWKYQEEVFSGRRNVIKDYFSDIEHQISMLQNQDGNADKIFTLYKTLISKTESELAAARARGLKDDDDYVQELMDHLQNYKKSVTDTLNELVSKASTALDELQDAYATFTDAAKEYADNGYLGVDSLQKILSLSPKYLAMLTDEHGKLVVNEKSLREVIRARTEELGAETALTYAKQILFATEQNELKTLRDITEATAKASNATWDMAYATVNLARAIGTAEGIDTAIYDKAFDYISKMETLTVEAANAAAKYYGASTDALNTILDLTKELIKHENEEKIDALEQEKDTYADIINQRKEMLNLAKKEDDHNDSITEKLKKAAKLQAQIAALSLDDSRSAQAQKRSLEEELGELQKDITKEQADYYTDAQLDALDKELDAFNEAKDEEIEQQRQMISSEERLYRAAIDRITNNWDTLYEKLKVWNEEYGSTLQKDLTNAWDEATKAVERYGSVATAFASIGAGNGATPLVGTDGGTAEAVKRSMRNNSIAWLTASNAQRARLEEKQAWLAEDYIQATGDYIYNKNGAWYHEDGSALYSIGKSEAAEIIVNAMKANSSIWTSADESRRKTLVAENERLAETLASILHSKITKDGNGVWWVNGKKLYESYHTGGIAGATPTLEQQEMLAVLEKGEAVLDAEKERGLYKIVNFVSVLSDKLGKTLDEANINRIFNMIPSINAPSLLAAGAHMSAADVSGLVGGGNYTIERIDVTAPISVVQKLDADEIKSHARMIGAISADYIKEGFSKRGMNPKTSLF